jgi:signal transduction histidine kinase
MRTEELLALAGVLTLGTLAVLHALVWRTLRQRWSASFSAGFALISLIYLFDAQLQPVNGRPVIGVALLAAPGLVLLMLGAIDYSGLPERPARLLRRLCVAIGVAAIVLVAAAWMSRIAGFALIASFLAVQAGLAGWAMRREPDSGHGLVLLALLSFPLALAATAIGPLPTGALRYLLIVPLGVTGTTILTTGLLRADRRSRVELQQRQQAQAELSALNAELEHRVDERTAELRSMVEGLESFNRSVSHDLRGPLGGIAGLSRLASEAIGRGDPATAARLLPAITAQAESSAHLVAALLSLSRLDEGELVRQPVALEGLVHEAMEQLRLGTAEAKSPPVRLQRLPTVEADPGLLRQVYVNLLGNAMKFTRGVEAPEIEVGSLQAGGETVLYVRDNGVGFEASRAERLFRPFQRLHGAQFAGHGVGLSIVRRIVERHGGRVWAESAPGCGAAFFFTLEDDAP